MFTAHLGTTFFSYLCESNVCIMYQPQSTLACKLVPNVQCCVSVHIIIVVKCCTTYFIYLERELFVFMYFCVRNDLLFLCAFYHLCVTTNLFLCVFYHLRMKTKMKQNISFHT